MVMICPYCGSRDKGSMAIDRSSCPHNFSGYVDENRYKIRTYESDTYKPKKYKPYQYNNAQVYSFSDLLRDIYKFIVYLPIIYRFIFHGGLKDYFYSGKLLADVYDVIKELVKLIVQLIINIVVFLLTAFLFLLFIGVIKMR